MRSAPTEQTPALPTLEARCYLLETADQTTGPLQSLVLDHLLLHDGDACWVDAAGHARTDTLARLAPSNRLLERIRVARGFTAYQHAALLERAAERIDATTALVVLPAVDALYREDDVQGVDAKALLEASVTELVARCRACDVPLVLTCHQRDDLSAPVARAVGETLRCETTQFGPRFVGDGFETLVYPTGDGDVQTTLAYWAQVLDRRARVQAASAPEVAIDGAN